MTICKTKQSNIDSENQNILAIESTDPLDGLIDNDHIEIKDNIPPYCWQQYQGLQ